MHQPSEGGTPRFLSATVKTFIVLALLFFFLVGIKSLGSGFKLLGKDLLDAFFAATANPFMGLMVGILATTLVQSSSVTTSMIVAMVAAPVNPLPLANAVPMVMGANIGTTVTNTVVALANFGERGEFTRSFAVATCHDFFNFMAVLLLLPFELLTGLLSKSAVALAAMSGGLGGVKYKSPLKVALSYGQKPLKALGKALFSAKLGQAIVLIGGGAGLILGSLYFLVKVLRAAMRSRIEVYLRRVLGRAALLSMIVGAVVTVMVQSSSITTSLLVPLAGAGLLTIEHAFPITLGANVGTTVTALLASLAVSGANAQAGVSIALVHLFFNLIGISVIYGAPPLRRIPLRSAEWLAQVASKSRRWAVIYTLGLFYGLPALLVLLDKIF